MVGCNTTSQRGRCPITTRSGEGCRAPLFRAGRCYSHHAYHLVFGRDPAIQPRALRCTAHTTQGTRCWIWTRARFNEQPECRIHGAQRRNRAALLQYHAAAERQGRVTSARIARGAALLDDLHPGWMEQIGEALTESR